MDSLFNKCCWENWIAACRKLKLDPRLSLCTIQKIKDLNKRPETLKLVQQRAGNTLELIGIDNGFLYKTKMAQQYREIIDKWGYMKFKNFCTTKELVPKF
jgi:hypothetical protein